MTLNSIKKDGSWDISHGEPVGEDNLFEVFRRNGFFDVMQFTHNPRSLNSIHQEVARAETVSSDLSDFRYLRRNVEEALRRVVAHCFTEFDLPRENVLDLGSGPVGYMAERLFPEEVDDKSVTQLDVNESSVRSNRSLHPKSRVVQGNYLDLDKSGQFDLITGLSSLDSTIFIDRVIEQIRDALRQGGFLFHVQDVLPGATIPRIEMLREGHSQPLIAEYPRQLASANLLDRLSQVTSYWSAREGCFLSSVELFRRHLAAAIKRVEGMEIVFDDWLTACNPNNPDKRGVLYSGIASNYGHFKPDSQMASAAVTVVKKL